MYWNGSDKYKAIYSNDRINGQCLVANGLNGEQPTIEDFKEVFQGILDHMCNGYLVYIDKKAV
jgi:hypothetical protein